MVGKPFVGRLPRAGKARQTRALEYPAQPSQRISYHPYAAPLHRIKTDDMLPASD